MSVADQTPQETVCNQMLSAATYATVSNLGRLKMVLGIQTTVIAGSTEHSSSDDSNHMVSNIEINDRMVNRYEQTVKYCRK